MQKDYPELQIDEKGAFCNILIDEKQIKKNNYTPNEIITHLNKHRVKSGINRDVVLAFISGKFKLDKKKTIAEKSNPTKGKDGYIRYLISNKDKESIDEEIKNINFYETGLIRNVARGEKLVKILSPTAGRSGVDIYGNEIPGLPGKEVNPKKFMGKNTVLNDQGDYIIAENNGVYQKSILGIVSVVEEFVVKGDVNFTIGNIKTASAVLIKGDLKAGFKCESGSTIQVEGVIEDSEITAKSHIICKSGIVNGVKIVKAHIIKAGYLYNRECICHNMYIEGMLLNSKVIASGEISAKKISGGSIRAVSCIETNELGNNQFIKTEVSIGINNGHVNKIKDVSKQISENRNYVEKKMLELADLKIEMKQLKKRMEQINSETTKNQKENLIVKKINDKGNLKLKLIKFINSKIVEKNKLNVILKKKYAYLTNNIEYRNPEVIVRGKVYPNVTVHMNLNGKYQVKQVMENVKFILEENSEVIVVPL